MTRNGKIARLPYGLRNELNYDIRNGKPGVAILQWLNGTREAQQVVARHFEGRPISEQNLTEWKAGGYQEWERHMETREWLGELMQQSDQLADDAERHDPWNSVADRLSAPLAVELARSLKEVSADRELTTLERLNAILAISQATAQLRRADHSRKRLAWQDYWKKREFEQAEEEKEEEAERQAQSARVFQAMYQEQEAKHTARMEAMRLDAEMARSSRERGPVAPVAKTKQASAPATVPDSRGGAQEWHEENGGQMQQDAPGFQGKSGQIKVNQTSEDSRVGRGTTVVTEHS